MGHLLPSCFRITMHTEHTKITIIMLINCFKFAIKLSVSYPSRAKFGFSIFILSSSAIGISNSKFGSPNCAFKKSSTSLETLYFGGIRSNCAFLIRIWQRFKNSGGNFRFSKGMIVMICRTLMSCKSLDMDIPHSMHSKKLALIEEVMTVWAA
jgi:hypothetical protein